MAKIAVIFVLIALCSVAMCKRIPREEPVALNNLIESLKKLGEAAENFAKDPKTKALIEEAKNNGEKLLKAGGEQAEKILGQIKATGEELAKDGQENFKKFADDVNQSVQDVIKENKKN